MQQKLLKCESHHHHKEAAELAEDEVAVVAQGAEVMKHKENEKNAAFSLRPVPGKAFPVFCYVLSIFGYVCIERWSCMVMCVKVQLQASFCPKRLPCFFSLCILERRKDHNEQQSFWQCTTIQSGGCHCNHSIHSRYVNKCMEWALFLQVVILNHIIQM